MVGKTGNTKNRKSQQISIIRVSAKSKYLQITLIQR